MDQSFKEHAKKWIVKDLEAWEASDYENGVNRKKYIWKGITCLLPLEIYIKNTAHILNYMLNKYRDEKNCWEDGWGGGVLIRGGGKFVVTVTNEVAINIVMYNMASQSICYIAPIIKTHLKKLCSHFLKNEFIKTKNEKIQIDDNDTVIDVKKEEIELLRDYFNESVRIMEKYEKSLIEKIIGEKTNNQFVINAIAMLESSIKDLQNQYKKEVKEIQIKWSAKIEELRKEGSKEEKDCLIKHNKKLFEINDQINQLKKSIAQGE
jgi:hypothetical protein